MKLPLVKERDGLSMCVSNVPRRCYKVNLMVGSCQRGIGIYILCVNRDTVELLPAMTRLDQNCSIGALRYVRP